MNLGKQVKAQGIISLWGKFRYLWNSVSFYIQIMQFGSVLLLVFNDSIRYWLRDVVGIEMSFYLFIGIIFALLLIGIVFEHKFTIPGTQRYAGEQFIKHSPFNDMQKQLNKIDKDNQLIKKHFGIKDEE